VQVRFFFYINLYPRSPAFIPVDNSDASFRAQWATPEIAALFSTGMNADERG
jgi:hypothetical protein